MSADLERSYRRALAWYPRTWREKNADVVVGTLLDVAEADHRIRPRRGELVGLAASGLSARLGVMLEPRARDAISTIALATGVGYPLAYFAFQLWSPWSITRDSNWRYAEAVGYDAFVNPALIFAALWTLALVIALTQRQRWLRLVITVAIVASIVFSIVNYFLTAAPAWYGVKATTMVFLATLGLLVLIGTPVRGRRLVIAAGAAFVVFAGAYIFIGITLHNSVDEHAFWNTFSGPLALALGGATLLAVMLGITRRTLLAQVIAISIAPWIVVAVVQFLSHDLWNGIALVGIAVALVSLGAALSAAFQRTSTVRREDFTRPIAPAGFRAPCRTVTLNVMGGIKSPLCLCLLPSPQPTPPPEEASTPQYSDLRGASSSPSRFANNSVSNPASS